MDAWNELPELNITGLSTIADFRRRWTGMRRRAGTNNEIYIYDVLVLLFLRAMNIDFGFIFT